MRGADCLARAMAEAGVTTVFSLSGNQIMPVYDALIDPGIRIVHTRHEAAAVFMADAYGQITGDIGVALVTAAPGFGNALGALYTAYMQEAPVVFLSGDSPVGRDGEAPFQEFPQVAAATPFVKKSLRPTRADDLASAFAEAVRVALSGRPGPVHIALPADILLDEADAPLFAADSFAPATKPVEAADLTAIRDHLSAAERPLILTGPQMSRSRAPEAVSGLESAFDCPVVDMESPRGLRDPALGVFAEALAEADAVLYLGKPVDFTTGFGQAPQVNAPTIMAVDSEPSNIDRARGLVGNRLAVAAVADAPLAARALIDAGPGGEARTAWRTAVEEAVTFRTRPEPTDGITADTVADAIQARMDDADEAIFICDGGEFGQWVQAFATAPMRLINGTSGAIGGCLPYAIAAKIARPSATVIIAMGDGTAGFHLAEFETAAREGTSFTTVIGNDARWNAEYMIQTRAFGVERAVGCELNPDARYDLSAAALGCVGEHVTDQDALGPALDRAIASDKPACLDVRITPVAAPLFTRKGTATPGAH